MPDIIIDELRHRLDQAQADGTLPVQATIDRQLAHFAAEFGPEALLQLDGQALLHRLHARRKDEPPCLAYWLEYKNDDEFSGHLFGSIAGGSGHKFDLLEREGRWFQGANRVITADEAAMQARRQRDELVAGHRVLAAFDATDPSDAQARALDQAMQAAAPELYDAGWAHKYWQLLHPGRLDTFHSAALQRFHLIKLLQSPPDGEGPKGGSRSPFPCVGRFLGLARELGVSTTVLCLLLGERSPRHAYWRVGTTAGAGGESQWDEMLQQSWASIGWGAFVPDLTDLLKHPRKELTDMVGRWLLADYPDQPGVATRKAGEIVNFATRMAEGDLVLACDGGIVVGIGRVIGAYAYREGLVFPHVRPVEWLDRRQWQLPSSEGPHTTAYSIGKSADNLLEVEQRVLRRGGAGQPALGSPSPSHATPLPPLDEWSARAEAALRRKGQAILYGPPGTGKTYRALKLTQELAARHAFRKPFDRLTEAEREQVVGARGLVRICTFHPNWGYEDFLEGVRPVSKDGVISFQERDGLFKVLCDDAGGSDRLHFLVIDEINRGDIPRIFGELLTVIEMDKREQQISLPVTGRGLRVPRNVFIVGTMNTADRSISLLDAALRRRFAFIELMPDSGCLADRRVGNIPLGPWLEGLNARLRKHLKRNARNLQVGHAYLMPPSPITSFAEFGRVLRDDIIPLLEDYCYDDFHTLQAILGVALVDAEAGCIREELFLPSRQGDLEQALLYEEMSDYAGLAEGEDTDDEAAGTADAT